ncbi:MAG TPA: 2OG-Fe(II) oxygenase [Cyclobacteriaceae bacterium]|jgi:SM-20-related protein|nr:2OG-Fe(II) oxygenase [Cytophagales bacterium]HMR55729.1 2OG-Fe(II) oxygenase [Cyclobacteriaceae bacterium]HNT49061.1 2OG-Fe(II) oxygenase [Cyclobacteriaceae bacterium]HRE65389.1 2OG-Fe(II) oxygenase [Cyclobacteriaceae bacterium]HRF34284.1 2OG-Fe(II) oxygenase [Cyclobacteriaceae bacterium]
MTFPDKLNQLADGLAEQGFAVIDHFLLPEEVDAILTLDEFQNGLLHFKKAGIGHQQEKQINEGIRGDYIQWIDRATASPAIQVYLQKLNTLISFVNQSLYLSLKDYEVHLTQYPPGTFYKRHLDQFKKDDHRKLSAICYLNPNWKPEEGGQLRLYLPDKMLDILPEAGRLVCFRSDLLEHEVLPATRPRLSLTGWLLDQVADLRHL